MVGHLPGHHHPDLPARVPADLLLLPPGLLPGLLAVTAGVRGRRAAHRYTGETRFPLILQNVHRYFFYFGLVFNCILTYDAVLGLPEAPTASGVTSGSGPWSCVVNAALLWAYSLSCHSCRHIIGGRLKHFSRHPIRFKMWGFVSKLNSRHMQLAWASLIFVALTDLYVRLAASG